MAQQVAGFAYWISVLVAECGLPVREELPKEKRRLFRELARFLLTNEFDDVIQIVGEFDLHVCAARTSMRNGVGAQVALILVSGSVLGSSRVVI